jgi:hypothetical protein
MVQELTQQRVPHFPNPAKRDTVSSPACGMKPTEQQSQQIRVPCRPMSGALKFFFKT